MKTSGSHKDPPGLTRDLFDLEGGKRRVRIPTHISPPFLYQPARYDKWGLGNVGYQNAPIRVRVVPIGWKMGIL